MNQEFPEITINAHSSIRIQGSKTVWFDPYLVKEERHDADVIFITHDHFDHFSAEDVQRVSKTDTILVTPRNAKNMTVAGLTFETVPAYNIGKKFHPKEKNWVGYLVTMDGVRYYVAGDTDVTPELLSVQADVAMLPVGGTYTMTAGEAAEAAKKMEVPAFIPTHYGSVVGTKSDGEEFKALLDGSRKVVLKLD